MVFEEKNLHCTEVVAELTIHFVWVISQLVSMQLYRSPTRQNHRKIHHCALSSKKIQAKYGKSYFIGMNLSEYRAVYATVLQPKTSPQQFIIFHLKYSYMFHRSSKEISC